MSNWHQKHFGKREKKKITKLLKALETSWTQKRKNSTCVTQLKVKPNMSGTVVKESGINFKLKANTIGQNNKEGNNNGKGIVL